MNTNSSPFLSETFERIWMKHFQPKKALRAFKSIGGLRFYRKGWFPIYINSGRNLTKGNYYRRVHDADFRNKVFVIYDVPTLPSPMQDEPQGPSRLKRFESLQYPGFLIEMDKFNGGLDAYLLATFSKNSRMKLRKFTNRLESSFKISTEMFYGDIDKEHYDFLFEEFMRLLVKRYSDKEITYNNMQPKEWAFYKEVAYPLILEGKASLFVIYDGEIPIAITYNYHYKDTVIDAITVFDVDYSKFNLGYVNNLKLIEWCLDNKVGRLDFSKGYFEYKKRLCNVEYQFENHVLYDAFNPLIYILAFTIHQFFNLKQILRKRGVNEWYHKLTYSLGKTPQANSVGETGTYSFHEINEPFNPEELKEINFYVHENTTLKQAVYEFLYLNMEARNDISVYSIAGGNKRYLIKGKEKSQLVQLA